MSTTPARPRQSGIPGPTPTSKTSGIPTPGRGRSTSTSHNAPAAPESDMMSRAFADAIKANDPAHHRFTDNTDASLLPDTTSSLLRSGRRSVTGTTRSHSPFVVGNPSKSTNARVKTPVARPSSRQSDVFTRSSSRLDRKFDVGDNVRIESLGFEGTLRYLGSIDGKSGEWAGVELSGGFSGKGKNDGTVNGKAYFTCPPKCGVFVAMAKISPPTVGIGAISRPSSVASSFGYATPSLSGRITPSASTSTGRITPSASTSAGRITPHTARRSDSRASVPRALTTPTSGTRSRVVTPSATRTALTSNDAYSHFTPGSRASRYVGLTAKQLHTRDGASPSAGQVPDSPTRRGVASSTQTHFTTLTSPSSKTPRAGTTTRLPSVGIGLPSTTPGQNRGRVPSAIAMPPPASPISVQRAPLDEDRGEDTSSPHHPFISDLASNGQLLQDKISQLLSGKTPSATASPAADAELFSGASQTEDSLANSDSTAIALSSENEQLKAMLDEMRSKEHQDIARIDSLHAENERALSRIAELESSNKTAERTLDERATKMEALERSVSNMLIDIEKVRSDGEARARDLQSKFEDKEALVKNLKEAIELKEGVETENNAILKAKDSEISLLEARVQKAYSDLEEERKELGGQVNELRQAGQETIALYEERLSTAEARRYELEDSLAVLQEQIRGQSLPLSPTRAAQAASSAVQIENEALRDQIRHLQMKVTNLEDMLEEVRTTADKEETLTQDKLKRHKDKEESLKKQLNDSQAEMERTIKAEVQARSRVEEIEEALRESTVALENARAEVETLRSEIADLESITSNHSSESSGKLADLVQRASNDRARFAEETIELKRLIEELKTANELATLELEQSRTDYLKATAALDELKQRVSGEKVEISMTGVREEMAGLKHIVQELQKENTAAAQQNKLLESENKILLSETEQLRREMRMLETNAEKSLVDPKQDLSEVPQDLRDARMEYEMELDRLRKKQAETEMQNARTIHDLHKEVSELESLIESKIYHEDELEQEIDRLKDKLSRGHKKSSKGAAEVIHVNEPLPVSLPTSNSEGGHTPQDVCEICEQPGHDIFTCDVLKGEGADVDNGSDTATLFCVDCEGHGHTAADCPYSTDVF